jgi:hypothetical protein
VLKKEAVCSSETVSVWALKTLGMRYRERRGGDWNKEK